MTHLISMTFSRTTFTTIPNFSQNFPTFSCFRDIIELAVFCVATCYFFSLWFNVCGVNVIPVSGLLLQDVFMIRHKVKVIVKLCQLWLIATRILVSVTLNFTKKTKSVFLLVVLFCYLPCNWASRARMTLAYATARS